MARKNTFDLQAAFDELNTLFTSLPASAVSGMGASSGQGKPKKGTVPSTGIELSTNGVHVSLDESAGLQNAANPHGEGEDGTDNDISLAMLPSALSDRLNSLWSGHTPIGAALSGYDGSNTGENILSLQAGSSGTVQTAFTDADGNALSGYDSALQTTDGTAVFLWTDSVDANLVLGRKGIWSVDHFVADPNGDIVFAGYLQQTGTPVTGAKMWTVQYESLFDPDSTNTDEPIDLADHLWVTASEEKTFSLKGVPSGQNLFLMIGDSQVAIVITGQNPVNQSNGGNISRVDTVNTSQTGGGAIGTSNQSIDPPAGKTPGEGMYFTFVTGANPNYTAPNLTETTADVEANILFDDLYTQSSASFRVVQVTGSTMATLKVSAFNTTALDGVNYVDGLSASNNVVEAITGVAVYQLVNNSLVPVTDPLLKIIDNQDGTFTVQGIKANYTIAYQTESPHSRLLVQNIGSKEAKYNGSFDIGGLGFGESETTTQEIGSHVHFEDDAPSASANAAATAGATLDETGGLQQVTIAASTIAGLFNTPDYGQDDAGSTHYALSGTDGGGTGIYVNGNTDEVQLVKISETEFQGWTNGDTVAGTRAFTVSMDADTGLVTVTQNATLNHPTDGDDAAAYDDMVSLVGSGALHVVQTVTDGDGDWSRATSAQPLDIGFHDDGPSASANAAATAGATLDETGGLQHVTIAASTIAGLFNTPDYGQDDAGSVHYALSGTDGGGTGIYVNGSTDEVQLVKISETEFQGWTNGDPLGGVKAFTVSIDADTGLVTVTQNATFNHPTDGDDAAAYDDMVSLIGTGALHVVQTVTDGDGDWSRATSAQPLDIGFHDDGPVFRSITNLVGFNIADPLIGFYGAAPGTDAWGRLVLTGLTGTVDGHSISNAQLTLQSETPTQTFYTFSFDYVPGPNSSTSQTASGVVKFNTAEGTYLFDINAPILGETTYSTSSPSATYNYDQIGNKSPEIVVQMYDDHFFGVLTGRVAEPPSDTNDLTAGGDHVYSPGEVFDSAAKGYMNIATSTVGVNSDTVQAGELVNYDFYAVNPVLGDQSPPQNPASSINPDAARAYVTKLDITLDQINVGQEDLAILLKLHDADSGDSTTRLLIADAVGDYVLDPATGNYVVSIGKDDYDSEQYKIAGVQVLSSTENVTGEGYRLSTHEVVNLGVQGKGLANTSDNDVFKIIKIDVTNEQTATFNTDLQFEGQVIDRDADWTPFSFDVHLEAQGNVLTAPGSADALNGTVNAEIFKIDPGASSLDLADAQYVLGYYANFQTGQDSLQLGVAGDAAAGTGNYVESASAVDDYAAALAAANIALATLHGTSSQSQLYAFEHDDQNGYLFEDTNSDGVADQVIVLVGLDHTGLMASDIVA